MFKVVQGVQGSTQIYSSVEPFTVELFLLNELMITMNTKPLAWMINQALFPWSFYFDRLDTVILCLMFIYLGDTLVKSDSTNAKHRVGSARSSDEVQ